MTAWGVYLTPSPDQQRYSNIQYGLCEILSHPLHRRVARTGCPFHPQLFLGLYTAPGTKPRAGRTSDLGEPWRRWISGLPSPAFSMFIISLALQSTLANGTYDMARPFSKEGTTWYDCTIVPYEERDSRSIFYGVG